MMPRVSLLLVPVDAVMVGLVKSVTNEPVKMVCTVPIVKRWARLLGQPFLKIFTMSNYNKLNLICRFVNARITIRSYVIRGLDSASVKWDGTAKPVPGPVPSTHTARTVRIVATAKTTRSARLSTALASARPDIAERIAASCAPWTRSGKTARRSALARTEPVARLRTDAAIARLVSVILRHSNDHTWWWLIIINLII